MQPLYLTKTKPKQFLHVQGLVNGLWKPSLRENNRGLRLAMSHLKPWPKVKAYVGLVAAQVKLQLPSATTTAIAKQCQTYNPLESNSAQLNCLEIDDGHYF